jgi:hypothetical protein
LPSLAGICEDSKFQDLLKSNAQMQLKSVYYIFITCNSAKRETAIFIFQDLENILTSALKNIKIAVVVWNQTMLRRVPERCPQNYTDFKCYGAQIWV